MDTDVLLAIENLDFNFGNRDECNLVFKEFFAARTSDKICVHRIALSVRRAKVLDLHVLIFLLH